MDEHTLTARSTPPVVIQLLDEPGSESMTQSIPRIAPLCAAVRRPSTLSGERISHRKTSPPSVATNMSFKGDVDEGWKGEKATDLTVLLCMNARVLPLLLKSYEEKGEEVDTFKYR